MNTIYCVFYNVVGLNFQNCRSVRLSTCFRPWTLRKIYVFMFLNLFSQLAYVSVLHWLVGLYYYGFLVNEGICITLVIQTFCPTILNVLYPPLLLYNPLPLLYIYLNPIILYKPSSYACYTQYFLILLCIVHIYYYVFIYIH